MKKINSLLFFIFLVACLSACNIEEGQDNRSDFLTGDNVNYQSGNSRTNADGKHARSTISTQPSGHQDQKISTNNQQNQQYNNKSDDKQTNRLQTDANINQTTQPNPSEQTDQQEPTNEIISQVVQLTNQERQKNGLGPLSADHIKLREAAQMKSNDMSQNNYFSHTSPTYGSPFQMMKDVGIEYEIAAENIASGQSTAQEVVTSWMNSPGHRQNILNKDITHIGVGYAASGNYWTQLFIKK